MLKKIFCLLLFFVCSITYATTSHVKASQVKINLPFNLTWHEPQAKVAQQGISLVPESFIIVGGFKNIYLAASVPKSTYKNAIYKFGFDNQNKLASFAIYQTNISQAEFNKLKADVTKKYGKGTYSKRGKDNNYYDWGNPIYGYLGLTYQSDSKLLQTSYFLPIADNNSD